MSESLHERTTYPADSVNRAFGAQQRWGQHDWDAYLEGRPSGSGSDPVNDRYEQTLTNTSWDNKGLVELAKMGRSARLRGDWTTLDDIQDNILERIAALSEGEKGTPWSDGELFNLIDRLDAVINGPKSPEQSTPNQAPVAPVTGEPHASEAIQDTPDHQVPIEPIESDSTTTQGLEPEDIPRTSTSESAQGGGDGPHDDKPKPSPVAPTTPTAPTAPTTPPYSAERVFWYS